MVDPEIAGFYALGLEAERLWTWGRLERVRTRELGAGFALEALVTIEGVGNYAADPDALLDDPARREALLRAIRRVEAEPALLGASPHLLAVARRRTD